MTAPMGSDAERAVQRLVHLVASGLLERGERLHAAQALVMLLQDADPAAADLTAAGVERRQALAAHVIERAGAPVRGGQLRRGLRAAGELLDFLNPF